MIDFPNIFSHKLFKNTSIYTITNTIRQAIPFFLLPILTRYLTPSDYGVIATFEVVLLLTVILIELNTCAAVTVNFFTLGKEKLKIYIGNVILISVISFILTFTVIYIFRPFLSTLLKFPEEWLSIFPVIALSQFFILLVLTLWQAEENVLSYGVFQILQSILDVSLSLLFVVILYWKWQGRILGATIASITFAFLSVLILRKRNYIHFSLNKIYVKDALLFGIPLVPHVLGAWIMMSVGRIFVNSMVGIRETGIYTVGCQVGMIIGLLATSFNKAWVPFSYRKLNENNYSTNLKIVKLTYLYDVGIVILSLVLSLVAPFFLKFFVSDQFYSAYKYVKWVALGYAFQGMYFMVVNYIFYVKKTYILPWITFSTAALNMILTYFFIKANGAIGAAQAMTVSFFVSFILTWILSARVYKMPWRVWNYAGEAKTKKM